MNPHSRPDDPIQDSDFDHPLKAWSRIIALVLGILAGGAGGAAVFLSANQAGTVALLLVSGVLTLVGIQGTPLRQIRTGENGIELARLRDRAREEIKRVIDSEPSEIAEAVAFSFSSIDPVLSRASSSQLRHLDFEAQVGSAIKRVGYQVMTPKPPFDRAFDLVATSPESKSIAVEILFFPAQSTHRSRRVRDRVMRFSSYDVGMPVLIIVNGPIDEYSSILDRFNPSRNRISLCSWQSTKDDKSLLSALGKSLENRT